MDSSQATTTTNFTIGDQYEVMFINGRMVFVKKNKDTKEPEGKEFRVIKVQNGEVTLEQVNK